MLVEQINVVGSAINTWKFGYQGDRSQVLNSI